MAGLSKSLLTLWFWLLVQGARHLDYMLREGYPKRAKVARQCLVLGPHLSKLAAHRKCQELPLAICLDL